MNRQTTNIDGKTYDKNTGIPVNNINIQHANSRSTHSNNFHKRTSKSAILNRKYVKRKTSPVSTDNVAKSSVCDIAVRPSAKTYPKTHMPKSDMISRFPKNAKSNHRPVSSKQSLDIRPAKPHPIANKASLNHEFKVQKNKQIATPKPSHVIKKEAEHKALQSAPKHNRKHKETKKPFMRKLSGMLTAGLAVLLISGYFTYINMPNLSIRVAAVRSGIDASYPSYRPTGYSLNGPITYDNGKVQMKFALNGSSLGFTVNQEKSNWDSSALLENYVVPKVENNYTTTRSNGLTIYSFEEQAAWVSGGILYTIEGDAPLSADQIHRIAISM